MLKRISLSILYLSIGLILIYSYSNSASIFNMLIVVIVYSATVGVYNINKIIENIHCSLAELAEYFVQLFVVVCLFTLVYLQQQTKMASLVESYIVGCAISLAVILGSRKSKSKKAKK